MAVATVRDSRGVQRYGTIVVVGGGCYGGYYVRQLQRARQAQSISWERLMVVDRASRCPVALEGAADIEVVVAEWGDFLERFLGGDVGPADAIVPSPLMPHLLFDWLVARLSRAGRHVRTNTPPPISGIPWQRAGDARTRYVSFAEWMCPVNCIEPVKCPHTKGERTWSLRPSVQAHVAALPGDDPALDAALTFQCTHRAYGVGMIDVGEVLAAEAALLDLSARGPVRALVGTVSHCHGALGVIEVS